MAKKIKKITTGPPYRKRKPKRLHQQLEEARAIEYTDRITRMTAEELASVADEASKDLFHRMVRQRLSELQGSFEKPINCKKPPRRRTPKKQRALLRQKELAELGMLLNGAEFTVAFVKDAIIAQMSKLALIELIRLPATPGLEWAEHFVSKALQDRQFVFWKLQQLKVDQLKYLLTLDGSPPKEWIAAVLVARLESQLAGLPLRKLEQTVAKLENGDDFYSEIAAKRALAQKKLARAHEKLNSLQRMKDKARKPRWTNPAPSNLLDWWREQS